MLVVVVLEVEPDVPVLTWIGPVPAVAVGVLMTVFPLLKGGVVVLSGSA